MMAEAAQITGFGQDRQRIDRPDARDLCAAAGSRVLCQQGVRQLLDLVALADQAAASANDHAEHGDGRQQSGANGRPMEARAVS